MDSSALFIDFSAKKLEQLLGRIRVCVGVLTPEQVWLRHSENENAIGNLLLHLTGNVRQWILSGVAGETDLRVRDQEFAARQGESAEELLKRLAATVAEAVRTIRELPAERLGETVTIQNYQVSVLEAIYHVVEHFSQHTGQIAFATKLFTGEDLGFYKHVSKSTAAPRDSTP